MLRPDNSPVVLLCFYSGKVVVTGGKFQSDIHNGWANLWPTVRRFIRQRGNTTNTHNGAVNTTDNGAQGSSVLSDIAMEPTDADAQEAALLADLTTDADAQEAAVLSDSTTGTNTKRRRKTNTPVLAVQ